MSSVIPKPSASTAPVNKGLATIKSPFAAAVLAVMFLISGSVAIYSGRILLTGEETDAIFNRLPQTCEWLSVADRPAQTGAVWQKALESAGLPDDVTPLLGSLGGRWLAVQQAGQGLFDPAQPWAISAQSQGILLAAPTLGPADVPTLTRLAHALLDGAWPDSQGHLGPSQGLDGATCRVEADRAQCQVGGQVRIAGQLKDKTWLFAIPWRKDTSALAFLHHAEAEAQRLPLQKNKPIREALERVGGGQGHLFVSDVTLRNWVSARTSNDEVLEISRLSSWLALAVRQDDTEIAVHAHVGVGQKGAVWLKERLDTQGKWDATPLVLPQASAWLLTRVHPHGLVQHPDLPGVNSLATWARTYLELDLGPALAATQGHSLWQSFPAVGGKTPWLLVAPAGAGATATQLGKTVSWLPSDTGPLWLAASDAQTLAQAKAAYSGKLAAHESHFSSGQARLLTETQGLWLAPGALLGPWHGPVQAEWLWLDTGLVAELSTAAPGAKR